MHHEATRDIHPPPRKLTALLAAALLALAVPAQAQQVTVRSPCSEISKLSHADFFWANHSMGTDGPTPRRFATRTGTGTGPTRPAPWGWPTAVNRGPVRCTSRTGWTRGGETQSTDGGRAVREPWRPDDRNTAPCLTGAGSPSDGHGPRFAAACHSRDCGNGMRQGVDRRRLTWDTRPCCSIHAGPF